MAWEALRWWNWLALIAAVPLGVLGGGALLSYGARRWGKAAKAGLWKGVWVHLAETAVAMAVALPFLVLGPLAGAIAGIVAAWTLITVAFDIGFLRAFLALATVLPVTVASIILGLGLAINPLVMETKFRDICSMHLGLLGRSLLVYTDRTGEVMPSLEYGEANGHILGTSVRCPAVACWDSPSYFYLPRRMEGSPVGLVACDYGGNHIGGGRAFLRTSGQAGWMGPKEFETELSKPENAAFAAALRAAEIARARAATQPASRPATASNAPASRP